MAEAVTSLIQKISQGSTPVAEDVRNFTPHQTVLLLQELVYQPALPLDTLQILGKEYGIVDSHNYDIIYR
jgi:hypothetical protein